MEIQQTKKSPLICIKDLDVAYQDVVALVEINLDIYENDFIGIFGPNASGKSTLLKSILGLIEPINGSISFLSCTDPSARSINIGYVPQVRKIDRNFPALVQDVVSMGRYKQIGYLHNVKANDENIKEALIAVGMWRFRKRPIGHLSGGQQQKVYIARALSANPSVLLLDEPTAALDFRIQQSIMELIYTLHKEKKLTVILVTHNLEFLKKYATRIVCLDKKIIWQGHPSDPKLNTIIQQVFNQ